MLIRRTELSATTKLSAEHETPPIANVLLAADAIVSIVITCIIKSQAQKKMLEILENAKK